MKLKAEAGNIRAESATPPQLGDGSHVA